ncbi:hypothetical protein KFV02_08760 [Desulfohalobiaceae bacterium Ax17]|uniref:hypothetical protein n=1 Tax=Desulfovulcanus ferrireducens TaxID=2831190 RepID=UPI00207BC1D9|nr:hypothetical protein [Desulfovulcanus ferrireducens]MBT8764019.1 hypothetical protein [Desulfovulcanus ferrireducens]
MSVFVEKLIKVGIALTRTRELENFLELILGARAGICADYGFRGDNNYTYFNARPNDWRYLSCERLKFSTIFQYN